MGRRYNTRRRFGDEVLLRIGILLFLLLMVSLCIAQSKTSVPAKLDRICGKLEKTKIIPEKGNPSFVHTESKNLARSELKLFARTGDESCCNAAPVAEVKTNHWGNFNFKNVSAGAYWLVASVDGKDVRMPIEFAPDRRSTSLCSEQVFYVDEQYRFGLTETITVD